MSLVDERWVDNDDASNENLVKTHLLQTLPKMRVMFRLKPTTAATVDDAIKYCSEQMTSILPFDVVILRDG